MTNRNDGTSLEDTVAAIESHFVPKEHRVERRKRIVVDGKTIAELDIVISGKLGTADCELLIECRDRPSGGPAPAAWIEQLTGRRQRFKLSNVIAVSSSGYSDAAVSLARQEGVILRTTEQLTAEDIAGVATEEFTLYGCINMLHRWKAKLDDGTLIETSRTGGNGVYFFSDAITGESVDVGEVFRSISSARGSFGNMKHGDEQVVEYNATFREMFAFRLDYGDGPHDIVELYMKGTLLMRTKKLAFESATLYCDDRKGPIALLVQWKAPAGEVIEGTSLMWELRPCVEEEAHANTASSV